MRRTSYVQISLEETVRPAAPSDKVSRLLASVVLARGLSPFRDQASIPAFQARMALVSRCFPEYQWPEMREDEIYERVAQLCSGKRSLEELAPLSLIDSFMEQLTDPQRILLRREAPERIQLKSGRPIKVHYSPANPPWIESRLQDFFGTYSTPRICAGQVPLTIHLLAPNGRAVQVTQDLAGFWERHYSAVRRELRRRYPKHAWPEPGTLKKD